MHNPMILRLITCYLVVFISSAFSDQATQQLFDIAAQEEQIYKKIAEDPDYYSEDDIERRIIELLKAYETYLKEKPDDVDALILYAKLLRRTGEDEAAFKIFLRADELSPDIAVVKQQIGTYMAEQGKAKVALLYYQQSVELEPHNAIFHYSLGQLLYQFRDDYLEEDIFSRDALDREMIKAFRTCANLAATNFDFQARLGAAYYDLASPDWKSALLHWNHCSKNFTDPLQGQIIALHKARVLGKLGRHEEARELTDIVTNPALQQSRQQVLDEMVQF